MGTEASDATAILTSLAAGDRSAADRLFPLVYDELRAIAARQLGRHNAAQTLQPTALVHEAYLRLVDQARVDWNGTTHFMAIAATVMRRVLVDHARARDAIRRGGSGRNSAPDTPRRRVLLESVLIEAEEAVGTDLLALDRAMEKLRRWHERRARVVELRVFGGLSVKHAAAALDVSERTIEDDWAVARVFLARELSGMA
ncbi:MAG TPA: ECF-type sigma factor [Phycisphaerales bacterium]|nr:ECF-type sigma factor [Phycisphaerales bacterium]